jgi:hypothetical protein
LTNHRLPTSYARPEPSAFSTLLIALGVWGALFGIGCFAWSVVELLR